MIGPLLFALLVAVGVLIAFLGLLRTVQGLDPMETRLKELGVSEQDLAPSEGDSETGRRPTWPMVSRLLAGLGLGSRLATDLMRADIPLTAAEFALIILGVGLLGFVVGTVRMGPLLGLALGLGVGIVPYFYVRMRQGRRLRAMTDQLPDVLTLLVGSLRSGYGITQSMDMLVEQLAPPASTEFARVLRAVGFGVSVQRALSEMAERVGSDDLDLVVTAVNVQYEMGGNLAQTLETIGETVRERIRIFRQIRVLTAQQRITGYVLALWPVVVAIGIFLINPGYISRIFEPDLIWLPVVAVLMQIGGFLMIRRIVDIEV
ncbi:type II secretion system F family protein [Chloroflexota bacterium]